MSSYNNYIIRGPKEDLNRIKRYFDRNQDYADLEIFDDGDSIDVRVYTEKYADISSFEKLRKSYPRCTFQLFWKGDDSYAFNHGYSDVTGNYYTSFEKEYITSLKVFNKIRDSFRNYETLTSSQIKGYKIEPELQDLKNNPNNTIITLNLINGDTVRSEVNYNPQTNQIFPPL